MFFNSRWYSNIWSSAYRMPKAAKEEMRPKWPTAVFYAGVGAVLCALLIAFRRTPLVSYGAFVGVFIYSRAIMFLLSSQHTEAKRRMRARLESCDYLICSECGYELRGLNGYRCPECGTIYSKESLEKRWRRWLDPDSKEPLSDRG